MRYLLLLITWLALLVAARAPVAAQRPTLTITTPTDGSVIQGTAVTVSFQTSGITLRPSSVPFTEAGTRPEANRPGEGHLHLTLDLQPVVVRTSSAPYTFTQVPPGEHQLTVEVTNNDHSPFTPPVVQQIRFRTMAPPAAMMPNTGWAPRLPLDGGSGLLLGAVALVLGGLLLRQRYR